MTVLRARHDDVLSCLSLQRVHRIRLPLPPRCNPPPNDHRCISPRGKPAWQDRQASKLSNLGHRIAPHATQSTDTLPSPALTYSPTNAHRRGLKRARGPNAAVTSVPCPHPPHLTLSPYALSPCGHSQTRCLSSAEQEGCVAAPSSCQPSLSA